ncbi:MAG: hypothetical protein RL077_2050 [Verrucomicrobiota bacterium]
MSDGEAVRGVETGRAWAVGPRLVWRIGARRSSDIFLTLRTGPSASLSRHSALRSSDVCLTLRTGWLRLGDILGRFGEFSASRQLALLPALNRDGGLGVAEQIFLRSPPVRLVCGDGGGLVAIRVHGEKANPEASDRGIAVF